MNGHSIHAALEIGHKTGERGAGAENPKQSRRQAFRKYDWLKNAPKMCRAICGMVVASNGLPSHFAEDVKPLEKFSACCSGRKHGQGAP